MTTFSNVQLPLAALRRALVAVYPHISADKDNVLLYRVRLYVSADQVIVAAANGVTAALCRVRKQGDGSGELGVIDLVPLDVKKILAFFKLPKKEGSASYLGIEADEKWVELTDVSGMFPGVRMRLKATPIDPKFPNVAQAIRRGFRLGTNRSVSPYLSMHDYGLKRFLPAATEYGALTVEVVGRAGAMVITAGSEFAGMLVPTSQTENWVELSSEWRGAWEDVHLHDVDQIHPVPPVLPGEKKPKPPPKDPDPAAQEALDLRVLLGEEPGKPAKPKGDDQDDAAAGEEEAAVVESFEMFSEAEVENPLTPEETDALTFRIAVEHVVESGSASRKSLQKLLRIGAEKVTEYLRRMERHGVIGPVSIGNEPRPVLWSQDTLDASEFGGGH